MQSGWLTRWTGWASISKILGILAGLLALALAGRKMNSHRMKAAEARRDSTIAKEKAVLAEAGIEKAVYQAKVVEHGLKAVAHEQQAADYEARVAAAKAKVARLRGRG